MRHFLESSIGLKSVLVSLIVGLSGCSHSLLTQRITPPTQTIRATLNSQAGESSARFSYDGRYLVFVSDRLPQRSIFLYDLTSRQLLSLPGLNQVGILQDQPDISADGRYIVYVSEQFGKPDIFLYDRSSLRSQRLTSDFLGEVRHPSISGNGRFIAFESNRLGQWDIEIIDRGPTFEPSLPQPNSTNTENSSN